MEMPRREDRGIPKGLKMSKLSSAFYLCRLTPLREILGNPFSGVAIVFTRYSCCG